MDVICVYENPKPTKKERLEELESVHISSIEELEQELSRWFIDCYTGRPINNVRVWTQEEYDNLQPDEGTMYYIADN